MFDYNEETLERIKKILNGVITQGDPLVSLNEFVKREESELISRFGEDFVNALLNVVLSIVAYQHYIKLEKLPGGERYGISKGVMWEHLQQWGVEEYVARI